MTRTSTGGTDNYCSVAIYNGVGHFEVAIYNGVGQFDFKLSHPVVDGHLKMSHPVVDCHAAVIVRPPRVEVLVTSPPPVVPLVSLPFFFKIFFFNFRLILTLFNLFTSLTQFLLSLIVCCEVCLFV